MARFKNVDGKRIEFTAEEETERDTDEEISILESVRQKQIEAITTEAVLRISDQVPAWDDLETIKLIKSFVNLMDWTKATPAQVLAKDIHGYARAQITWAKTATVVELDNYEASTDPGWPV